MNRKEALAKIEQARTLVKIAGELLKDTFEYDYPQDVADDVDADIKSIRDIERKLEVHLARGHNVAITRRW